MLTCFITRHSVRQIVLQARYITGEVAYEESNFRVIFVLDSFFSLSKQVLLQWWIE